MLVLLFLLFSFINLNIFCADVSGKAKTETAVNSKTSKEQLSEIVYKIVFIKGLIPNLVWSRFIDQNRLPAEFRGKSRSELEETKKQLVLQIRKLIVDLKDDERFLLVEFINNID